jgi:hypothetical protein
MVPPLPVVGFCLYTAPTHTRPFCWSSSSKKEGTISGFPGLVLVPFLIRKKKKIRSPLRAYYYLRARYDADIATIGPIRKLHPSFSQVLSSADPRTPPVVVVDCSIAFFFFLPSFPCFSFPSLAFPQTGRLYDLVPSPRAARKQSHTEPQSALELELSRRESRSIPTTRNLSRTTTNSPPTTFFPRIPVPEYRLRCWSRRVRTERSLVCLKRAQRRPLSLKGAFGCLYRITSNPYKRKGKGRRFCVFLWA